CPWRVHLSQRPRPQADALHPSVQQETEADQVDLSQSKPSHQSAISRYRPLVPDVHWKVIGVGSRDFWQSLCGTRQKSLGGPQRREGIGNIVAGYPSFTDLRYNARERL